MSEETSARSNNRFICPHCRESLSHLDDTIVRMKGRLSCETFSVSTVFSMSSQLGRYGAVAADDVKLYPGAVVDFYCPHCGTSFTSPQNDKLSVIHMVDLSERELVVAFDRVYGEHSSFLIDVDRGQVVQAYGEHSSLFHDELSKSLNFFGS